MSEVTVVIPNFNGKELLRVCLAALANQTFQELEILVVDNGSKDDSPAFLRRQYPQVKILELPKNHGFCGAVNRGIRASESPYVLLLNNDTEPEPDFVEKLYKAVKGSREVFSCQALLLDYGNRTLVDDAGDYYCALGWAFARGKGKPSEHYQENCEIFAACGGAAIYRRTVLEQLGGFDERHFAYLEDIDVGYRARIRGYRNLFVPEARVYHMGSATTGSRYNEWKVRLAARNSLYLAYKNMPLFQLVLNMPFLFGGVAVKFLYFRKKHLGRAYLTGVKQGISLWKKEYKTSFCWKNWRNYCRIQLELWKNMTIPLRKF